CTYCASPRMWTTRWYARDPEKVVDEIEGYVKKYGANNFPFQDLTAILKKDWIVAFCKAIINRGLDIRWQFPSGTRCEVVDDDVAPLLFQSGCRSMCYAPESGSDETRRLIKKKMKKEALFGAVDAAVKQKINLTCFIVLGFPHDTDAMIRENFKFVRELAIRGVEDIACGFFFPIPATELYDYLADKGKIDLSDKKLLAPILVHDRYLTPDRNFSDHIPSWRLTLYRYLVLLNFYPLAFLTHPGRVARIVKNVILRREESKLDSFLNIYTRNLGRKIRMLFGAKG
ncbi:MAG: radical SAM protein, partial [Candidatus Methylomirabilis sp.]|nr:radical SAM protein [Deltaproteobacteria bacterium]